MTVNEPMRVCPPDTQQARTDGLRASAVKKGCLLVWPHPGEWAANAQKPGTP